MVGRGASREVVACMMAALTGLLPSLTGCYKHVDVPAGPEDIERGDRVRVYLAEPRQYRLQEVSPNNVVLLDGEAALWTDTSMVLSTWWLRSATGREFRANGESVHLALPDIERIERREIAALKTAGLALGVVGAAVLVGAALLSIGGGENGGNGGQPPIQDVIPAFPSP